MSKPMTSNSLIESIKRRASVPENQATFSADDFLELASEELVLGVVPAIMSVHEDYFLFEERTPLLNGQNEYPIPSRALGNKLRDVQWAHDDTNISELTRIGVGERFAERNVGGGLRQFYVKNNKVAFTSAIDSQATGELIFIYYIRPSSLVSEDRIGIITGINDQGNGTTKVIVNTLPENFNTSIEYDFYKAETPSSIIGKDIGSVSGDVIAIDAPQKAITFKSDLIPSELKIGDHLAQACESSIPQIPSELHPMLAQMVACRILEAQGDTQGLQNALLKLKQMETAAGMLVDSRVDDAPQKVVNRHGTVRSSIFSKRFNRR